MKNHDVLEMEKVEEKYNNQLVDVKLNSFNNIHNIFNTAILSTKWKNFCAMKRKHIFKTTDDNMSHQESHLLAEASLTTRPQIEQTLKLTLKESDEIIEEKINFHYERTCVLLSYVARVSTKYSQENLNLSWIEELVNNGADINVQDIYGQTILHEVARVWHMDVAQCLISIGADVNCKDNYGRTPLHVAAAVDYSMMCKLLIECGADKEAKTKDEGHTPLFFAARNDATHVLKMFIDLKCEFQSIFDYKNRTPLFVAAELDRSESARILLENGASAMECDCNGQPVMIPLISKMAPIAKTALDQFHVTNRATRRQTFQLYQLEPVVTADIENRKWISVLKQITKQSQYELIMHEAVQKMVEVMWQNHVKWQAYGHVMFQLLYIFSWSVFGVLEDWTERYMYNLPFHWYRIVIFALAVICTAYQIIEEILEYKSSWRQFEDWKTWRKNEIEKDCNLCHPRWPDEKSYFVKEMSDLDKMQPSYFSDVWNIFDWLCYFMLLVCIGTHIADICAHSIVLARWHIRIMAVTNILLWIRLMKFMRAFSLLGPFIVVLGHMVLDVVRFLFLYLEFYIPYAFAFWMLFGGSDNLPETEYNGQQAASANATKISVNSFSYVNDMLFVMFRLTLGGDCDYDNMILIDHVMAQILVGTWLAISAVVCLNIFIALLSNTFQRVFDNAIANSMMQKAITVVAIHESLSFNSKRKWHDFLREKCNPLEEIYDDDTSTSGEDAIQRATIEIRADVNDLKEKLANYFNFENDRDEEEEKNLSSEDDPNLGSKENILRPNSYNIKMLNNPISVSQMNLENEFELLRNEITLLRNNYYETTKNIRQDLENMKCILKDISIVLSGGSWKALNEEMVENKPISKKNRQFPSLLHVQPAIEVVEYQRKPKLAALRTDTSEV